MSLSRRNFLVGAGLGVASLLLSACGGNEEPNLTTTTAPATPTPVSLNTNPTLESSTPTPTLTWDEQIEYSNNAAYQERLKSALLKLTNFNRDHWNNSEDLQQIRGASTTLAEVYGQRLEWRMSYILELDGDIPVGSRDVVVANYINPDSGKLIPVIALDIGQSNKSYAYNNRTGNLDIVPPNSSSIGFQQLLEALDELRGAENNLFEGDQARVLTVTFTNEGTPIIKEYTSTVDDDMKTMFSEPLQ